MIVATAKRSACDRCRNQKLRCLRPEPQVDGPCARCIRAGALCATGSPRRLGRPRTKPPGGPLRSSEASLGTVSPRLEPDTMPITADLPVWDPMTDYPTTPSATSNIGNCQSWMVSDATGFDEAMLGPLSSLQDLGPDPIFHQDAQSDGGQLQLNRLSGPQDSSDTLIGLSQLSESLTRQISRIASYSWGDLDACNQNFDSMDGNPLSQVVQSTSNFNAILERLLSKPRPSSFTSEERPLSPPMPFIRLKRPPVAGAEPPSTPTLLLLLSNYLQLVQLYDALFERVCDILQSLRDYISDIRVSPALGIAGVSSLKGPLYCKVMIDVVEDHIDNMDSLMGLPAEVRLSGQIASSEGVFSTLESSNLLQIVMTQIDSRPGSSGISLVASLRQKLRNSKRLLQNAEVLC